MRNNPPLTRSEAARASKHKTPWSRGPHCDTPAAIKANMRYKARGKKAKPCS